jgi:hypothetical protein
MHYGTPRGLPTISSLPSAPVLACQTDTPLPPYAGDMHMPVAFGGELHYPVGFL